MSSRGSKSTECCKVGRRPNSKGAGNSRNGSWELAGSVALRVFWSYCWRLRVLPKAIKSGKQMVIPHPLTWRFTTIVP